MRFVKAAVGVAVLAAVVLAAVAAAAGRPAGGAPRLVRGAAFRTTTLTAAGARALVRRDWTGGSYTTSTGEVVTVFASASYADPDAVARRWADFFASLEHGPELAALRAYIAPLGEVRTLCRDVRSLGCYGGGRLIAVGDDTDSGIAPESVAEHEYGHHVAANRLNPPWDAVDWGTKRWASYLGICSRAAAGTAFPGDEAARYGLNPGEGFAEAYRVLSEVRAGATQWDWPIVDPSFAPDATALRLVEEDVLHPYAPPPEKTVSGRITRRRPNWRLRLDEPLDGELRVTLRLPPGAGHELTLGDGRGRVLAHGLWSGSGRKSLRYPICGQRSLVLRVSRRGAAGRFALAVQNP